MADSTPSSEVQNPQVDPTQKMHHQVFFYHDREMALVTLVTMALGLIVALGALIVFQTSLTPDPVFFEATEAGQLLEQASLENPYISTNGLLNWTSEALINSFTFNHINVLRNIGKAKDYYIQTGFDAYLSILRNPLNGPLGDVIAGKYVLTAIPAAAPEILSEGIVVDDNLGSVYAWNIQVPIKLVFRNLVRQEEKRMMINLYVVRVPSQDSQVGIKIYKFKLVPNNSLMPRRK